jgi:outer membrane lipoprotein-sorting protein
MRRLILLFTVAAFALSVSAQDLDKILNDHYKASGQDKISQIKTVTITGKLSTMGMESGLTMYQARPTKLRVEAFIMGGKMIQTYNGTTGWIYGPTIGITQPMEMSAADLKNVVSQAEINSPLWDYEAKGNKLELAGMSDDGSAYKVKLTTADGDEMFICISKETSLMSKVLTSQMVNGMESDIEIEFKDYKTVKGIPTAHYMGTKMGGQTMSTITFETIDYDKDLDPSLFEKPAIQ